MKVNTDFVEIMVSGLVKAGSEKRYAANPQRLTGCITHNNNDNKEKSSA